MLNRQEAERSAPRDSHLMPLPEHSGCWRPPDPEELYARLDTKDVAQS
jgi:hypothetical protein